MFQKLYQIPFYLGALLLTSLGNSAFAETSPGSIPPIVGMMNMSPVTPQEAAEYLNKRVVPPSSLPSQTKTREYPRAQGHIEKEARIKLNVEAVLGHEPPVGTMTTYGFKRADFSHKPSSAKETDSTANPVFGTMVIAPESQAQSEQIQPAEVPEINSGRETLTK
ncbi:hypothetical protein; putative exported protein [Xenorhabdus nematophila ATCC 19061]|uniref:Uncharacterized protein n=1 Tax=Xenorhabdus nematophila (strain ATCC 19061 / DSM 3370 / CCUG 14189 / LMG 1036 / NCIMB 9965 / AN6) TaxID=406817 RepID=D3VJR5_XENNA|nr:hypothetical protein [Xenorhabdus nematophila]CBJ90974.1 hypothetical protein; putative exported protein [Xenorhabdus nematophila ATCC 19061]CEE90349.1 hypothetical protein; putative exported protein [Xenorhabdus nematophila str. Anatoliense]CEE91778.1 hypothetical protein; putative exported protein [Xenorhabdus nematophila str. Anatoliense]CEK23800.1 hypothetical protein; putative exported protein [Xenorhabdus nematophila AN6/1]